MYTTVVYIFRGPCRKPESITLCLKMSQFSDIDNKELRNDCVYLKSTL